MDQLAPRASVTLDHIADAAGAQQNATPSSRGSILVDGIELVRGLDPFSRLDAAMVRITGELDRWDANTAVSFEAKRSAMQQVVQHAIDVVTKLFSKLGDIVVEEVKAGGSREVVGREALTHVETAMDCMRVWTSTPRGRDPHEILSEVAATLPPLKQADDVLRASGDSQKIIVNCAATLIAETRFHVVAVTLDDELEFEAKREELQRAVQSALDLTTKIFGTLGEIVVREVKAGGYRESVGRRAMAHLHAAIAAMESWSRFNAVNKDPEDLITEMLKIYQPLSRVEACLRVGT